MSKIPIYQDEHLILLRKSRSDNPDETVEETLERHEKQLQKQIKKELGFTVPEENIYREVVSGGENIKDRPVFMKLLKRLEVGNIVAVWCVDPQRLSRSGMYGAGEVLEIFEVTDTKIATLQKTYDLKNPMDKKMLEMIMIQSAEYLGYSKEVMTRGRITSVMEGKYIGSSTPFGYDKEPMKKGFKLIINEEEAEVVRTIFELCIEGVGTSNIANYLNKEHMKSRTGCIWTPQMVRNVITNEAHNGKVTYGKRKVVRRYVDGEIKKVRPRNDDYIEAQGLHETIVTKEEFILAQEKLKNNAIGGAVDKTNIQNPLAGLVFCSECGHAMIRRPYNKSYKKHDKRKYEIDKPALQELLRTHKEKSGLSLTQIANELNVTRDQVIAWFNPKIEKMHLSKVFSDKWFELKKLLNIKTNKFDKSITTYEKPKVQKDSLICSLSHCKTVSSELDLVEHRLIETLKAKLDGYIYFVDNYEEVIKKEVKSNARTLERIDKEIEKLNKRLKNAKEFYELGDYTRQMFLDTKEEVTQKLEKLEEEKSKILKSKDDEKLIKIKKAVPLLKDCLEKYGTLTIPQKNEMLKTIINKLYYTKLEGGRWNIKARDKFKLEIDPKI